VTVRSIIQNFIYIKAVGWTIWGSSSSGGRRFLCCPEWLWGPHSLLFSGYQGSFSGIKWPGYEIDHSPPSNAKLMSGYIPLTLVCLHGMLRDKLTFFIV
jgi:hypothetical protein